MTVFLDLDALRREVASLEQDASRPDLWNDRQRAQTTLKRLGNLRARLERWDRFRARAKDVAELAALSGEDPALEAEVATELAELSAEVARASLEAQLSGPYDERNAVVAVSAGVGGTDAADWAEMLVRMYLRWAERRGFRGELLDMTPGDEAGFRSATLSVEGDYAYGYLKTERGTHRLVRISPFDFQKRRQTSFALVDPTPQVESETEVDLRPEDLKIDTYRSTGAGGQNVNKTETAVRITHLPTGIVVACQNERSQLQNKETAMRILRARLLEKRIREQEEEQAKERGELRAADWGSQIRSYVLQPYTLVKDHRTGVEVGDPTRVLDGDIDGFIEAALSRPAAALSASGIVPAADTSSR
ncbi:MAG: peptide chain release factor 2 [Chloroflexi bacterium]|nr:MAG: peptide chain release factor 2 [Chloroflexota bacterium]TMG41781.1 MAG: peptide chain release factor 2 [Chloroflexota bacterium]